jgi:hypothetical protein
MCYMRYKVLHYWRFTHFKAVTCPLHRRFVRYRVFPGYPQTTYVRTYVQIPYFVEFVKLVVFLEQNADSSLYLLS